MNRSTRVILLTSMLFCFSAVSASLHNAFLLHLNHRILSSHVHLKLIEERGSDFAQDQVIELLYEYVHYGAQLCLIDKSKLEEEMLYTETVDFFDRFSAQAQACIEKYLSSYAMSKFTLLSKLHFDKDVCARVDETLPKIPGSDYEADEFYLAKINRERQESLLPEKIFSHIKKEYRYRYGYEQFKQQAEEWNRFTRQSSLLTHRMLLQCVQTQRFSFSHEQEPAWYKRSIPPLVTKLDSEIKLLPNEERVRHDLFDLTPWYRRTGVLFTGGVVMFGLGYLGVKYLAQNWDHIKHQVFKIRLTKGEVEHIAGYLHTLQDQAIDFAVRNYFCLDQELIRQEVARVRQVKNLHAPAVRT